MPEFNHKKASKKEWRNEREPSERDRDTKRKGAGSEGVWSDKGGLRIEYWWQTPGISVNALRI